MEFVQFFPIGHLWPRLVCMDPIMWDPFRYKLGGKLLNAEMREFEEDYVTHDKRSDGRYVLTCDLATYAITKEVEAGRGSPAGGAYLSFQHVPEAEICRAFGPLVDRLAANGIDLARAPVEVAPIAHYHMGGVRVDAELETGVAGLYVCGEAVGGANRLSGNAITEAFVFGARAGRNAALRASKQSSTWSSESARPTRELLRSAASQHQPNPVAIVAKLQTLMAETVGPFRTEDKLQRAIAGLAVLKQEVGEIPWSSTRGYDAVLIDWLDLRNMVLVAQSVALSALARTESRGAHQREDHPGLDEGWGVNQVVTLSDGTLNVTRMIPPSGKPRHESDAPNSARRGRRDAAGRQLRARLRAGTIGARRPARAAPP